MFYGVLPDLSQSGCNGGCVGEIGDICNGLQTTATLGDGHVYTVQKLWSNRTSTCATP